MKLEWHHEKNQLNILKHGIDFEDAEEMFLNPMLVNRDEREDYGEARYIGVGYINHRLMVVIFTKRHEDVIRIISLRKANQREQIKFKKALKDQLEES